MELFKTKETFKEKVDKTILENCMAENDFKVTSIFNVIIRICMKKFEFRGKISKFLSKRCLFISFFFNSKTEILSLVTLVTNYHKLWSDPDENLKNKN